MRYERIREDKGRQDSGLETGMAVGRGSASLMPEAVDETFRFVWALRRWWPWWCLFAGKGRREDRVCRLHDEAEGATAKGTKTCFDCTRNTDLEHRQASMFGGV
jgi:hypothetical protein